MEKYYFELMAKFNKSANEQINNILKTITDEQWKRQFSGFYIATLVLYHSSRRKARVFCPDRS